MLIVFELTIFLLSGQNVTWCTCGFVLQSDWYRQRQVPKVNNFSHECYQALPSPVFEERARERGYNGGVFHLMLVVRMFMTFLAVTGV